MLFFPYKFDSVIPTRYSYGMSETANEVLKMCWNYLYSYLADETKSDLSKAEILKKLLSLTPSVTSLSIELHHEGKIYNREFSIRYRRGDYPELAVWKKEVFKRDNWTCQKCGQKSGNIEAHHIKSWSEYPDMRFDLSNGQTLCKSCHKKTENYGRKALTILK